MIHFCYIFYLVVYWGIETPRSQDTKINPLVWNVQNCHELRLSHDQDVVLADKGRAGEDHISVRPTVARLTAEDNDGTVGFIGNVSSKLVKESVFTFHIHKQLLVFETLDLY